MRNYFKKLKECLGQSNNDIIHLAVIHFFHAPLGVLVDLKSEADTDTGSGQSVSCDVVTCLRHGHMTLFKSLTASG